MRVCIIGCGAVARRMHIPVFKSLPDTDVVSVVDTNEELAKEVAKEFSIGKFYADYQKALNLDDVDLVSICTPSFTHSKIIIHAAELGKNILVEKPLTLDLDEGKRALEAVKANGVQLCVVFNYRKVGVAQEVFQEVANGKLGRVVSMIGTAHTPFPSSWTSGRWLYHEGGALDDFGPHLLDILLWINPSEIESVSAQGGDFTGKFNFVSHIQVSMKFKDTSLATADISWLNDAFLFGFDVHGTAGRISCDMRNNRWHEVHGQVLSPLADLSRTARESIGMITSIATGKYFRGGIAYHSQIIDDFVKSITAKTEPPVTGDEALVVTAVSTAAKQSLKSKQAVFVEDLLGSNFLKSKQAF
jgi:UDP-N-acetylglucosamine 3-dehydrogenase